MDKWLDVIKGILPTVGTALGGPLGGGIGALASTALGLAKGSSKEDVIKGITQALGDPEKLAALQKLEVDAKVQLAKLGYANIEALEKLNVQAAAQVNATMQAEAKSENWPTYVWRPFIGLCFGILSLITGSTVAIGYVGVMFFKVPVEVLAKIPEMLTSMSTVLGIMLPILGIASFFRGKMQVVDKETTNGKSS